VEKVEGVRFGNRGRAKDGRRKSRKSRTEHKMNRRVVVETVKKKRSKKVKGCKEEIKLIERDLRLKIFEIDETKRV